MIEGLKLPVGIENFQEIREEGFYYVDKTEMIEQLLTKWGKVNLFTRPRRFGKTLNMSMLRCFFEIGADAALFEGLYISKNENICKTYMGKYPVIFISLKNVDGLAFDDAKYQLSEIIGIEAERFHFLLDSAALTENDKEKYRALIRLYEGKYIMGAEMIISSLQILSHLLQKHYGKKVIVLIDEYDVPLDKAFQHGYYSEMTALIRGLFGKALKSNDALHFAVLTGCLRVSKESIFTGLNNFKVFSIEDARFDECFGFTKDEVKKLLKTYDLELHLEDIKEWYDGYHFGDADIYCPWDVINYVDRLMEEPDVEPQSYWINSSGNDLVKKFIEQADQTTKDELEKLISGESITKMLRLDLTYDEIENSVNNLWSVLFTTGYLTLNTKPNQENYSLKIPNKEIREVFQYKIMELFNEKVLREIDDLQDFWNALKKGNARKVEDYLTQTLENTISFFDITKSDAERFYHAFLAGMLTVNASWGVVSNRESGNGRADIIINTERSNSGIIIELKKADTLSGLDHQCRKALLQIHERAYDLYLRNEGRNDIWAYGIAFYKKRCRVMAEKLETR